MKYRFTKLYSSIFYGTIWFFFTLLFSACSGPTDPGTDPLVVPSAPEAPSVTIGYQRLVISWEPVPGTESYNIYCGSADETGEGTIPPTVSTQTVSTGVEISDLINGTTYYIWLNAKNSAGTSGFSPVVSGTPNLTGPRPSLIRGNGSISVSWAVESGVNSYLLYSSTSNDSAAVDQKGSFTGTGTVITGLSNGTEYYFWLKAVSGGNTSAFSEESREKPEASPTTVPTNFSYIPGGTVSGSGSYAFTVTVPNNPAYNNPGAVLQPKGIFVEGRTVSFDSFFMAKNETTQELWYTVQQWALDHGYSFQNIKSNPTDINKNKPVVNISWRDAIVWCNAYSEKDNKDPVYRDSSNNVLKDSRNANGIACDNAVMDKSKNGYRLPTEVEREFAARGGDPGLADWMFTYAGSDDADEVAWHHGNSSYKVNAVGTKAVNRLDIYDLSGNVQEWGWDWMNYNMDVIAQTPLDGVVRNTLINGRNVGNQKPFNGGGVGSNETVSCVAYRWGFTPDYKDPYVGFRVVCKVD